MHAIRPIRKLMIIVGASAIILGAMAKADAGVLLTPGYVVVIAEHCPEGVVGCDNVTYSGVDRASGAAIALRGKAWMHLCADGVTPCHHQGWIFRSGKMTYTVTDQGELSVQRGAKVLLDQKGKWVE